MPGKQPLKHNPEPRYVDPNKFDLMTHEFNARGHLKSKQVYRLHIKDGIQLYERPVGSGNLFYDNNEHAGRVEIKLNKAGKIISKTFDREAAHKEFKVPVTGAEKLEMDLAESDAKLAAALKELEAIKAERAQKEVMASKVIAGDEVTIKPTKNAYSPNEQGVSRSSKDAPISAALTEPKSSSTPVNPKSGHAAPVQPVAEAIRAEKGEDL